MDKEKFEEEAEDFTGFSEKKAAQAVDKIPGSVSKVPITLFSSNKKASKIKKIIFSK